MKSIAFAATALALAFVAGAAHAEPATYNVDPNHTDAIFEISHFGTSTNRGRFAAKDGTVQFDRASKTGKVEVNFDTAAVNTGVPALDKHLQSKDFFDVANFPTAKFVGDKFSFDGDKVSSVDGMLTLMGKTFPVTLKADHFNCYTNAMLKREVCGGDFEAMVNRGQYGITWGANMGFPDAVHLLIQVEAIKQ